MTKSVPLDAPLDGDEHTGALTPQSVAHRNAEFCASDFAAILAQTPSISEFVRVWGNGSPHPFSFSLSHTELFLITCGPPIDCRRVFLTSLTFRLRVYYVFFCNPPAARAAPHTSYSLYKIPKIPQAVAEETH